MIVVYWFIMENIGWFPPGRLFLWAGKVDNQKPGQPINIKLRKREPLNWNTYSLCNFTDHSPKYVKITSASKSKEKKKINAN